MKCGNESGRSKFCRKCREIKQNAVSIVSQNKGKLIKLLRGDYLTPEGFDKFILYTNNILKYGKIYIEYKDVKRDKIFRGILGWTYVLSGCIAFRGIISLVIINL